MPSSSWASAATVCPFTIATWSWYVFPNYLFRWVVVLTLFTFFSSLERPDLRIQFIVSQCHASYQLLNSLTGLECESHLKSRLHIIIFLSNVAHGTRRPSPGALICLLQYVGICTERLQFHSWRKIGFCVVQYAFIFEKLYIHSKPDSDQQVRRHDSMLFQCC